MKRYFLNNFTVALLFTLVSFYIYTLNLGFFQTLELKCYDLILSSRGHRPISDRIVIVAIDEQSLKEQGRWPWPRTKMAALVERLTEAEAAVIGVDIFFPEPDSYLPFDTIDAALAREDISGLSPQELSQWLRRVGSPDKILATAIEKSDRTVLSFFAFAPHDAGSADARKLTEADLEELEFSQYSIVQRRASPGDHIPIWPMESVGMSLPLLMNAANTAGYVFYIPEKDGVVRRIPLVMAHGDILFPPLSLQALHEATALPLMVDIAPYGVDRIFLGDTSIPTNAAGEFLINYYGPANTFPHVSATDVLSRKVAPARIRNKIVLVGTTAAATFDIKTTPFGPLYPGVEAHANIIENILQKDFIQRPPWIDVLDMAMILGSGLLLGLIALYFRAFASAILVVAGAAGYLLANYYLFTERGFWVNTVYPVFTQFFVYSGVTLFRFTFEERQKKFIKTAFSQYMAPQMVERLVENPSLLKLGGERKMITAFFTDLAGFSTISEKITPEQLVELLNEYFTEMVDILNHYEGTLDKFQGDAIVAFFGAPIEYPDHALRACHTALDMQKRLAEMRVEWREQGRHELFMRIGINTGPMVVGNMGSKNRLDYTIMGDDANLGSRLEGVNKQYGTSTIISDFTYQMVRDQVEVRALDKIRVVGKSLPVKIYQLLAKKGELDPLFGELLPLYNQGLAHYQNKQWEAAIVCFEKVLKAKEDDGPSLTYFERCINFASNPPPADWDGVFQMKTK